MIGSKGHHRNTYLILRNICKCTLINNVVLIEKKGTQYLHNKSERLIGSSASTTDFACIRYYKRTWQCSAKWASNSGPPVRSCVFCRLGHHNPSKVREKKSRIYIMIALTFFNIIELKASSDNVGHHWTIMLYLPSQNWIVLIDFSCWIVTILLWPNNIFFISQNFEIFILIAHSAGRSLK